MRQLASRHHADHERHIRIGRFIKDIVYAANDGIVTTFAVVAASVGGALSPATILILGIANLIADGFSMASGNYLGTKSQQDLYRKEEAEEYREADEHPEEEQEEVRTILAAKGYAGQDLETMTRLVVSRRDFWVEFMMWKELKLHAPETDSPLKSAMVTFFSFVVAGSVPLLPYWIAGAQASFTSAAISTGAALFLVGTLRTRVSATSWWALGLEMLFTGGLAAGIAYGIGAAIRLVV